MQGTQRNENTFHANELEKINIVKMTLIPQKFFRFNESHKKFQ